MNSADFDPIFPDLSLYLFRNIFGRSTIASNGFECYSELARGHTISTKKVRFPPCAQNSFDSSRFRSFFYSEFKPFWFKNQAQLRIYGERVCKEFAKSFLQVYGHYVLTEIVRLHRSKRVWVECFVVLNIFAVLRSETLFKSPISFGERIISFERAKIPFGERIINRSV